MRILKAGKPPNQKLWCRKTTCTGNGFGGNGCHAVQLTGIEDLRRRTVKYSIKYDDDGFDQWYSVVQYYIECLSCGLNTRVDALVLLLRLQEKVKEQQMDDE
jgi:hypothetical protein